MKTKDDTTIERISEEIFNELVLTKCKSTKTAINAKLKFLREQLYIIYFLGKIP